MSWDAYLTDDRGHSDGEWNYTHNTSPMIYAVLEDNGYDLPHDDSRPGRTIAWWQHLRGMSGPDGAAFLDSIIRGLEADPERFRAMNPDNGWGDFDSFVKVLTEMRNAVPEWPSTWGTSG
jgi:hypothetical protein